MNVEQLTAVLHEVPGPATAARIDPWDLMARAGRRRTRRRAGLTACALAGAALVLPQLVSRDGSQLLVPAGPGLDQATLAELTVDGQLPLACGGAARLEALTAQPGAEKADTPEARGLRDVIAHDPTGGMSPQSSGGWVLIRRSGSTVTWGQRERAIGIGATLTLQRRGDRYVFAGSGGCGPVAYPDGSSAEPFGPYVDLGLSLQLSYMGDTCDPRLPRVVVRESESTVDVLLLRRPPPKLPGPCAGAGRAGSVDAPLSRPLAGRQVRNLGYVPARPVLSAADEAVDRARTGADQAVVDQLCRQEGTRRGLSVSAAYLSDVASVKAAVPATRVAWRALADDAVAADCYLRHPGRSISSVVAAPGVPSEVRVARHTGSLLDRVPEVGGRPFRN